MIQLSNRLAAIATFVTPGNKVADIGTDHGYIPIYLRQQGISPYCIASDINKGPIDNAKTNIGRYDVSQIDTRCGSGLTTIKPGEVDTAIIAGMGGLLIIDILRNAHDVVKGVSQLILQPQKNISEVRKYVHTIGFKIIQEEMLIEDGKYYNILVCIPGEQNYSELEYLYGKCLLECKHPILMEWLQKQKSVNEKIWNKIKDHPSTRKDEVEVELKWIKEAMTCMS